MSTKEKILLESLKLFSQHGYDGITVRDIASTLNIKPSSLYKHYSSKKDIFTSIINKMRSDYEQELLKLKMPNGNYSEMARDYASLDFKIIKKIGTSIFIYWTQNTYASYFRKMLTLEQYKQNEVSGFYQEYLVSGTLNYLTKLFSEMIQQNYFTIEDPNFLAIEFYSPAFLLMSQCDVDSNTDKLLLLLNKHFDHFYLSFKKQSL